MEQNQKVSLPSNIDSEVLEVINSMSNTLNSIAKGWKMLVEQLAVKDAKIAELEKGEEDVQKEN